MTAELKALRQRLLQHQCPVTWCPRYDPANATADDKQDASTLCELVPGNADAKGNYVAAVMAWQRAVARVLLGVPQVDAAQRAHRDRQDGCHCVRHSANADDRPGPRRLSRAHNRNIQHCAPALHRGAQGHGPDDVQERRLQVPPSARRPSGRPAPGDGGHGRPAPPSPTYCPPLPGPLTNQGWSNDSPGRMWFGSFSRKGGAIRDRRWNNLVRSLESAFIILDEVQAAPLALLLGIAAARDLATAAWDADNSTYESSPTTLMLSATPCDGGGATLCQHAPLPGQRRSRSRRRRKSTLAPRSQEGLRCASSARELAVSTPRRFSPPSGSLSVPLVDVGDTVKLAGGGARQLYGARETLGSTKRKSSWSVSSPGGGAPLPVAAPRRRRGGKRSGGPLRPPAAQPPAPPSCLVAGAPLLSGAGDGERRTGLPRRWRDPGP